MAYQRFAQGDLYVVKVDELPKDVKLKKVEPTDGVFILAHSETGHHHVIEAAHCEYMDVEDDPLTSYLQVIDDVEQQITHLRSSDTHAPAVVDKGIFRIRRGREYIPGGWRMSAD